MGSWAFYIWGPLCFACYYYTIAAPVIKTRLVIICYLVVNIRFAKVYLVKYGNVNLNFAQVLKILQKKSCALGLRLIWLVALNIDAYDYFSGAFLRLCEKRLLASSRLSLCPSTRII